jgi:hypothetical protein
VVNGLILDQNPAPMAFPGGNSMRIQTEISHDPNMEITHGFVNLMTKKPRQVAGVK